MDQERFDDLAKSLGSLGSRRKVLGALVTGAVASGIARATDVVGKGKGKGKGDGKARDQGKNKGRDKNKQGKGRDKQKVDKEALCDAAQLAACDAQNACCNPNAGPDCITITQQNLIAQPGNVAGPCGNDGGICRTCPPGTFCTGPANARICQCNAASCPGGFCTVDGSGNGTCNANGSNGRCGVQGDLTPQLCPNGCCIPVGFPGEGNCAISSATNCGQNGSICTNCGGGGTCTNGTCSTCNATTCPNGCCQNGLCQAGGAASACGPNQTSAANPNRPCQVCAAGTTCVTQPNQTAVCVFGSCSATTCPNGCCDSNGQCQEGNVNAQCGTGGVACAICPSTQTCTSKVCTTANCTPLNCPNGCCDSAKLCRDGNTNSACGDGGETCDICTANEQCTGSTCAPIGPTCTAPLTLCAGVCVNLSSNKANCGACGKRCGKKKRCRGGRCKKKN